MGCAAQLPALLAAASLGSPAAQTFVGVGSSPVYAMLQKSSARTGNEASAILYHNPVSARLSSGGAVRTAAVVASRTVGVSLTVWDRDIALSTPAMRYA